MMRYYNYKLFFTFILFLFLCVSPSYSGENNLERADALSRQVIELHDHGKYAEAVPIAETALEIKKRALGNDHPEVAQSLNLLGVLFKSLGNYNKAELLYKNALAINVSNLGQDHSRAGLIQNNLANLYSFLGEYAKAEPLYKHSLGIFKRVFGADHPRVAKTLNNLGMLYYALGDYAKAESSLIKALKNSDKALGRDHLVVTFILNNLAGLYRSFGEDEKAERLLNKQSGNKGVTLVKKGIIEFSKDSYNGKSGLPFSITTQISTEMPESDKGSKASGLHITLDNEVKMSKNGATIKRSLPYTLYLGSFRTLNRAENAEKIYTGTGLSPYWAKVDLGEKGEWYRVFLGHFKDTKQANRFKQEHGLMETTVKPIHYAGATKVVQTVVPVGDLIVIEPQNIKKGSAKTDTKTTPEKILSYPYSLHLASFRTSKRAERAFSEYKEKGLSPFQVKVNLGDKGIWYRLFTGYFEGIEKVGIFKKKHGLMEATIMKTPFANLIGIYSSPDELESKIRLLLSLNYFPYVIQNLKDDFQLFVGAFMTRAGAEKQSMDLKSNNVRNNIVSR